MNDDGCPHTLEQYVYFYFLLKFIHTRLIIINNYNSLAFLGSEKYPYKVWNYSRKG